MKRVCQIVRDESWHRGASGGSRRRTTRVGTRVDCLEPRALLSNGLTEFPIESPVGGGQDQLSAIVSGPDKSVWFIDNLDDAEQIGKIAPSGSITWFPAINDPVPADPTSRRVI